MDRLLVVAVDNEFSPDLLQSLRTAGWVVTITADIQAAKQFLQRGNVGGVLIDLNAEHDPERLKLLRFVQKFCPNTLVIMMQPAREMHAHTHTHHKTVVEALDGPDDPGGATKPGVSLDLFSLSPAQKRIAMLVAQAYPNREIARRLGIREQSVRNELSRIFKKMGVWSRVELTLLILKTGAPTETNVPSDWKPEFNNGVEDAGRKTITM
ncbi:MAG: hypothetical protein DMG65_03525 [Candidatus Angelobacter sp. Gp1-AA117]|nr:MAG: hypothetical protein DMG65_03525 [Candidatus Angelobacter sp. Gp1-AA117]